MIDLERVKQGKRCLLYTTCDLKKAKRARVVTAAGVYTDKSGKKVGVVGEAAAYDTHGRYIGISKGGRYPAKELCPFTAEVQRLFWTYEEILAKYLALKGRRKFGELESENPYSLLTNAWANLEGVWDQLALAFYKAGMDERHMDDDYHFLPPIVGSFLKWPRSPSSGPGQPDLN